jgi:hypothetical protein
VSILLLVLRDIDAAIGAFGMHVQVNMSTPHVCFARHKTIDDDDGDDDDVVVQGQAPYPACEQPVLKLSGQIMVSLTDYWAPKSEASCIAHFIL